MTGAASKSPHPERLGPLFAVLVRGDVTKSRNGAKVPAMNLVREIPKLIRGHLFTVLFASAVSYAAGCESPDDEEQLVQEDELEENSEKAEVFSLKTQTPDPSAAWANTGGGKKVCAQSLTVYDNGYQGTLTYGADFWIDHFGDHGNHAWGWGNNKNSGKYYWGWVYNGWFC